MKEEYLHFLWRMRHLPSRNLSLVSGESIEIVEFGTYNDHESGPDFFHAKVIIDDILWFGHIEFHFKASDWYKHNHQVDPAYDHVILHVVWENDREVFVKDRALPTLLLSDVITEQGIAKGSFNLAQGKNTTVPCTYRLEDVQDIYIEKEKEKAIFNRLQRKTENLALRLEEGYSQVLYELLATAFGAKVNKDPFWQLSRELPIKRMLKKKANQRVELVLQTSGLFDLDQQSIAPAQTTLQSWQWKKKGLRPSGFPEKRVEQFAHFVAHFDFDFGFSSLLPTELYGYLRKSFTELLKSNGEEVKMSKDFQHLVMINSFVPFLWFLGESRASNNWQNLSLELLQLIPAEENHTTKHMKKAGFQIKSAYDSQALLELYSLSCSQKKCLTCTIGNSILNR